MGSIESAPCAADWAADIEECELTTVDSDDFFDPDDSEDSFDPDGSENSFDPDPDGSQGWGIRVISVNYPPAPCCFLDLDPGEFVSCCEDYEYEQYIDKYLEFKNFLWTDLQDEEDCVRSEMEWEAVKAKQLKSVESDMEVGEDFSARGPHVEEGKRSEKTDLEVDIKEDEEACIRSFFAVTVYYHY